MKSFSDTCWDWSEIKVEIEDALEKIDRGFSGDPDTVEIYINQLLGEAARLRSLKEDMINHAHLLVPLSPKGAHSRRAVAS